MASALPQTPRKNLWKMRNGSRPAPTLRTSWVTGAATRPGIVEFGRRAEAFGVIFQPGLAHIFIRASADSLTDEFIALDEFWGPVARSLETQLAEIPTVAGKIRALERELLRRLRAARWIDTNLQPLTDLICRERGGVSVEWLSHLSGFSRQHLARKFRQQVGVTPKQFCRFTRFQALVTQVVMSRQADWASVAAEFGYYD